MYTLRLCDACLRAYIGNTPTQTFAYDLGVGTTISIWMTMCSIQGACRSFVKFLFCLQREAVFEKKTDETEQACELIVLGCFVLSEFDREARKT